MKINRVWAMPNKWTFKIAPIKDLIMRYVGDGKGWIDPFSGFNSPAEFTNDLNPSSPVIYHLEAKDFLKKMDSNFNGCLFDPPYSATQTKECYENYGIKYLQEDARDGHWGRLKILITNKIKDGGHVLSFGWSSNGIGKKWGFEIIEILLVAHGGSHNDTICIVEKKIQGKLFQPSKCR